MNQIESYRIFRTMFLVVLALCVMSACKEDETTGVSGETIFLENPEVGLYTANTRAMVYQKYEHQLSRSADGRAFRLQTDNLSQVVACTFAAELSLGKSVEVTLRTVGIPKVTDGTSSFAVKKIEGGKCWLWDNKKQTGIIVPVE